MKVFLPCRSGSQRVRSKNTRVFAGNVNGLLGVKLAQLLSCKLIDEIVVSTNDPEVVDIASGIGSECITIDQRPEYLCGNNTTTDELAKYAANIWSDEHFMWTHVTCPFFDEVCYTRAIEEYVDRLKKGTCDSVMGVRRIQTFLWDSNGPINNQEGLKWPFTQSIDPIFEVDSTVFIVHSELAKSNVDRIGRSPFLLENDRISSLDIDYETDFQVAEKIWSAFNHS